MALLRPLVLALLVLVPLSATAQTVLLMAEEVGCPWCAQFDREISEIYPKTSEGRAAPLLRYDIHGKKPEDVVLESRVRFTPTFILIRDGVEVERIEGYPGEDFFWGLLGAMLDRAGIERDETG